jgi:hypothetical protein
MRIVSIIILLATSAFGITGDFNDDHIVNFLDYGTLAVCWQQSVPNIDYPVADLNADGTVDYDDLAIFAYHWLEYDITYLNVAPATTNTSATPVTFIVSSVPLTSTDDGLPEIPGKLKYIITSLPAHGYLQDPISGGQSRITAVPYTLSSWGDDVFFATDTAGADSFQFKTFDGLLYGNTSTVSLTVAANPQDCLSFDGSGSVTVPDNDLLDLVHGRGIAFFVNTRKPYQQVLRKHETGSAGYEFWIVGGKPQLRLFTASSQVAAIPYNFRIDNGRWHHIGFVYDSAGKAEINITDDSQSSLESVLLDVPINDYTNACNLIIGGGYKWQIDNIRSYSLNLTDVFYGLYVNQPRATAGDVQLFVPTCALRFKCDYDGTNNTSTQIYDDISVGHLIGTFNSSDHVKYIPFYWHWYDSAAFQQH